MLGPLLCTLGTILLVRCVAAQTASVSLYPTVDPVSLATAFNISNDCLEAL